MKSISIIAGLVLFFSFYSCNSPSDKKDETTKNNSSDVTIIGTWELVKEIKNGKEINYEGKPTALRLTLKDNGYFILFDKITDEKIQNSGVASIQEYYKGQYKNENNSLTLNHYEGDSTISMNYHIKKLSVNELVLDNKKGKHTQYFAKQ